jgi:hypothetical protein
MLALLLLLLALLLLLRAAGRLALLGKREAEGGAVVSTQSWGNALVRLRCGRGAALIGACMQ